MMKRIFLAFSILLSACSSPGAHLPPMRDEAPGPYTFDSGDQVRVVVYGQPAPSGEHRIDDSGMIAVPLIGAVEARGKTAEELRSSIARELGEEGRKVMVNPDVTIQIQAFRPFYILGEVERPGKYPYVPGMNVLTGVAIGGGFTYRAYTSRVSIVRAVGQGTVEGRADRNTRVLPGDVIYVFERFI
jgi:polysaccharide export outer membrane protein